ncbi:MAG TPA: hypothetical protein VEP91_11650 [Solirubrobacterales bacterium]|nr:hypothetical protein [Solirubrobacterales bacterium]
MARLQIDVGAPIHEKEDAAWDAIIAANRRDPDAPEVMRRGNRALARLGADGELDAFDVPKLRRRLSQEAAFGSEARDGGWSPKDPPKDVALGLLAGDERTHPGAPPVERVVSVPSLGPSLELQTRPGYQPDSRTYYVPAPGLDGVAPPDEITTEDVEEARELLLTDLLGDFGFADDASRAHALALVLLPFVRDAIDGPTPMQVILAPDMGSGKTTLAQAALLPGCGIVPAEAGAGDDAEWRKRITSLLLAGRSAVILDNLTGRLDSAPLAAALTSDWWQDRVLGESRTVRLPVRNIWAITGNNLQMADDQVRRSVPIFLDPGEVRPADRPRDAFRHVDLLAWARRNRRDLVRAALTLVEHWRRGPAMVEGGYVYVRSGQDPLQGRKTMGSYEAWARVMGGILESCGMPGFLDNRDRLREEADEETRETAVFLAAMKPIAEGRGGLRFPEVKELVQMGGELSAAAPAEIADVPPGKLTGVLKPWLSRLKDKPVGGLRLRNVKLKAQGHPRAWYVTEASDAPWPADE